MKAYVTTNADCTRRRLDASLLKRYFAANGWRTARSARSADVIIVVTCAYTRRAEELAVEMVKRFSRMRGRLIVAGCLPSISPERLEEIFSGTALPTHSIGDIDDHFPSFKVRFSELEDAHRLSKAALFPSFRPGAYLSKLGRSPVRLLKMFIKKRRIDRVRGGDYYIRAGWGCRGRCSYCVIPQAIGKLRSKPPAACLAELEGGVRRGCDHFVLDADDLGAYGLDIGTTLPALLESLLAAGGDHTLSVEEVNPRWIVKYARDLLPIVRTGRVRGLCCCVQSGNERILRLMGRYGEVEKIAAVLQELKGAAPSMTLSTHVLAGFPSETAEEFEDTIRLLERIGFDRILVFGYGDKTGSRAAALEDKVPPPEIEERIGRLSARLARRGALVVCV